MGRAARRCKNPGYNDVDLNSSLEAVESNINGCRLSPASQQRLNQRRAEQNRNPVLRRVDRDTNPPTLRSRTTEQNQQPLSPYQPGSENTFGNQALTGVGNAIVPPVSVPAPPKTIPIKPADGTYGLPAELEANRRRNQNRVRVKQHPADFLTNSQVSRMTLEDRLVWSIKKSLTSGKLTKEMQQSLSQLLNPENLKVLGVIISGWAASHLCGVGELADAALLALGIVGLGSSVFSAGGALYEFFMKAENAKSYGDLVGSSDKFAELLDIIGTEGLAALIGAKAGQAIKGIGSALEKVGNGIGNFGRSAKARIDNVIGTGARFIEQGSRRIGNEIGGSFDRLRQKLFPQLQPAGGGQIPPVKKNEPLQSRGNGRRNGTEWKWGENTQPRKLLDYIKRGFSEMTGKDGVRIAGIVNESLEIIERQQGLAMANQVAQRMLQFYEVQYPALQQILADLNRDLPKIGALLPKYQLLSQGTKAQQNSLFAKLDPTDVIAAFRDNIGAPVLKPWRQGQPVQAFDHVDDVAGALKSLRTLRGTLSDLLKDYTYMQTPKIQEIMSPGQIIKYINSIDGQIRSIEKIITPGAYVSRSRSSASDLAHISQSRSRENSAENSALSLPESLAEISARNSASITNTLKIALELDRKWQEYDNATNGLARYHQPNESSPAQEQSEILIASSNPPQATEKSQWQY